MTYSYPVLLPQVSTNCGTTNDFAVLFAILTSVSITGTSTSVQTNATIGDEIKNENVTPSGSPALVKPMNSGMDEHEQNGVTVPSSAPMQFAQIPWNRAMIFLLRSGGK